MERRKIVGITPKITYYKKGSSFDYKAASVYSVAIHLDGSSVCIGVSSPKSGDIYSIECFGLKMGHSEEELIQLCTHSSVKNLLQAAKKNTLYCDSEKFALVPSIFFKKEQKESICSTLFKFTEAEELIEQFIPEIDSYIIFPFSKVTKNALKSKIGHTEISHQYASLISTYHLYYVENNSEMAFVHFQESSFTVCLIKNKKMMLFNVFNMNSYEDVLYYTYYSMEQYGFSPEKTTIHYGGFCQFSSHVIAGFQKYSSKIYHLSPKGIDQITENNSDKLISTIFDLQCG